MTDKERKAYIAEDASNYMRGRAMALSFKPLNLGDVKDAYMCGAEDMERLIDNSMWWKWADGPELPAIDREVIALTAEGNVVSARYGGGQWNAPDIKWWLDIDFPVIGW